MKHLGILSLLMLLSIPAHALIISVEGYGDIPTEAMEIMLNQPEMDILTGELTFKVDGSLLCNETLTVTITRSATGMADEFCCGGQCTAGNGETSETLEFTPNGPASWYVHYMPAPNSDEQITYTFSSTTDTRVLRVRYVYNTEDIEPVTDNPSPVTHKLLRNGIIRIERGESTYTLQGTPITNNQ